MNWTDWLNLKEGDIIKADNGDIYSVMFHDFYCDGDVEMCITDGISIWRGDDFSPEVFEKVRSIEFKYSDGGRSKYYKGSRGDCLCRAICNASGRDYKEVYEVINQYASKERTGKKKRGKSSARDGVYHATRRKIIEEWLGWKWVPTMQIGSGCKVHLRSNELPSGNLILSLSGHYSCVKDGILYDTYDCSRDGTRCVYGYWVER